MSTVPAAAASAAAQGAERGPPNEVEAPAAPPKRPPGVNKRTVALHIAYVGTGFSGLQASKDLAPDATVEGVLEAALLAAGLISPANYGNPRKTKWSRSSRTDKGVHSLCTVIGVRLLLDDARIEADPEGVGYAREINRHLPRGVRVLAVQRTTKKFNPRRLCGTRTYEYYLPAHTLGLASLDGTGPGDAERISMFRAALEQYVGNRPFHNFAGDRKQYVKTDKGSAALIEKFTEQQREREAAAAAAAAAAAGKGAGPLGALMSALQGLFGGSRKDDSAPTTAETEAVTRTTAAAASAAPTAAPAAAQRSAPATADSDSDGEEEGAAGGEESRDDGQPPPGQGDAGQRVWVQQVRWLDHPDPKDPVVRSHYRRVTAFTADNPRPLVPGGVPCLRLSVTGDSFMLHQIRNMVGAAAAVARGTLPLDLLVAALAAPGRVTVPRAPPHTLMLADNEFSPFAKGYGDDNPPAVARLTGPNLRLREGGRGEQATFRAEVFDAALNELLAHPEWDQWAATVLPRYHYPPAQVAALIEKHKAWRDEVVAKRAEAAAAREAGAGSEAE